MSEDNPRERQENEVEAIKAIYLNDVEDLRTGRKGGDDASWSCEASLALDPPVISIKLLPQRGNSSGLEESEQSLTHVILQIKVPYEYPNVVPQISVVSSKGLSSQEVDQLLSDLGTLAKESLGEVMILDLAQRAEAFLFSHQKRPTGSFYDEMLMRNRIIEEETMQQERRVLEKERLAIQEEIMKKQEALKQETRIRKEQWKAQITQNGSPNSSIQSSPVKGDGFPREGIVSNRKKRRSISSRRYRTTSEGSDSSISESSDIVTLEFFCNKTTRQFHKGELLGKSPRGSCVFAGMDSSNGSLVAICEWRFVIKVDKKGREMRDIGAGEAITTDGLMKQVHAFEPEFNLLQKLQNPNIVLYLGMKIVHEDAGVISLYLAQEFVRGTTLVSYLRDTLTLDLAQVRHCAQGILQGLKYLHANNIVHRFLRDSSVFLDSKGEVKMADYGLERKISELYNLTSGSPEVADNFAPSIGRGAKKGDVYRFGILILSLVKGQYVNDNPPTIPSSLPMELQDFLKKCLTTDEHSRLTAEQLLEHNFIKMPVQKDPTMQCFRSHEIPVSPKNKEEEEELEEADPHISHFITGHSRLKNEFEVCKWLGKGGFGDVLKVKNKLDGRIYALKRIRLNPRNKQLNKKITREVKLLSQLNHENVVRYFNSWIETVVDCESDESSSFLTETGPSPTSINKSNNKLSSQKPSVRFQIDKFQNSLGLCDNIEEMAPPVKDSEWSISIVNQNVCDDSDESSDDEDLFGTSFLRGDDEESEDVVFESQNSDSASKSQTTSNSKQDDESLSTPNGGKAVKSENKIVNNESGSELFHLRETQFMYIQMEFCEKSTLRTAIDDNLYEDQERVWRLFREIVEGLVHIHQQGMIHRDLKPVNIFLDSNDHVKIGDFGLATTNIFPKSGGTGDCIPATPHPEYCGGRSIDFGEESMTGHVGTALYVAPELVTTAKAMYNQKVDIYSLGIIFFEMFYRPLQTGMERARVIAGLRTTDIAFPSDFDRQVMPQQAYITQWLLSHDPSKRPTSLELLQSDYLPPPQMEEAQLREMFRHTLSNSQSKAYKYLMASCFHQRISAAENVTYDMDNSKLQHGSAHHSRSLLLVQNVKRIIQDVFVRHGGIEVSTPLLMPRSQLYDDTDSSVNLISHSGSVVSIPHDLRVPFARFVTRNTITHMKRYSIDRVFRERKVYGFHPRELIECAFDVINPTQGTLIADAEVISIVFEILKDLPWTKDKTCLIRLNHTQLLEGVLLHHGIDEKFHGKIKSILADIKTEKNSKLQIQTMLCSLCLPDGFISMLFNLMEIEGSHNKITSALKGITRRKGEAASKIKEGLHELEIVEEHIKAFGLMNSQCSVVINPTMVFATNVYSGLVFQVVCNLKRRKNKLAVDVIAAGGRYDNLISTFRSTLELTGLASKDLKQCGVGISISLDKLVAGFEDDEDQTIGRRSTVDALICSVGHPMPKEKIEMLKEFCSHGIICTLLDGSQDSSESPEDYCKEVGASFIVILKEGEYPSNVIRVRSWEKDRFHERKISKQEAVDLILKYRRVSFDGSSENSLSNGLPRNDNALKSTQAGEFCSSSLIPTTGNMPSVNISFVIQEKEKLANWKRRYENLMMSHISEILPKLSKQQVVELLGMEVTSAVINSLASSLQLADKEEYGKSVAEVIEKHPRSKKYLKHICDEIYELNFEKGAPVIIIYGLSDNFYRVLL